MEISNDELLSMIKSFKDVVDDQNRKIDELKQHIYDDFLNPAEENFKAWDHNTRKDEFKDRYKDSFPEDLLEKCKKAEGDENFDLPGKLFEDYEASDKSVEEADYVANVIASITEQLDGLKEALDGEKVEVTSEGDTTEVKVDGEPVAEAEAVTPGEAEAEIAEEKPAEPAEAAEAAEDTEPEEEKKVEEDPDEDELDSFIKELEDEAKHSDIHAKHW